MYSNGYFCDCLEYVKSNLKKNETIEYVELPKSNLPQPVYKDDPKRYWEIWKIKRGYKLYSLSSLYFCHPNILNNEQQIQEDNIRLYRTIPKIAPVKNIVPLKPVTAQDPLGCPVETPKASNEATEAPAAEI